MPRVLDFEYPELSSTDLIREVLFVKTSQRMTPIGVLWFLISSIYLLLLNISALSLVIKFEILYLSTFYTTAMGILFIARLFLGYMLEYLE